MRSEIRNSEVRIQQLVNGGPVPIKKRIYTTIRARIMRHRVEFERDESDLQQLLDANSTLLHNNLIWHYFVWLYFTVYWILWLAVLFYSFELKYKIKKLNWILRRNAKRHNAIRLNGKTLDGKTRRTQIIRAQQLKLIFYWHIYFTHRNEKSAY